MGGRKKRSAPSNQTVVSPTVSGINKDIVPTDFKTRTGKNIKPPTNPESNNTITWMSGIKKNWNLKGKKTINWKAGGVPRERPAFNQTITHAPLNQTITDAAFNQMITKKQQIRNGYNCGTSLTVDMTPCARRVNNRQNETHAVSVLPTSKQET